MGAAFLKCGKSLLIGETYKTMKYVETILFWHPENQKDLCFSIDLDRNCGYCEVRDDLSLIEDNMTEAVIFLFGYTKPSMMPKKRNPNQYWIWRTAEPPPGMVINEFLPIADDIGFNMTMTHRDNSDIRMPYADIRNIRLPDPRASLRLKTDLAMAAISNCDMLTGSKLRLEYLNLLIQAGMNITTIGECFPDSRPIPRTTDDQPDPIVRLVSQHKFYFSFENSYHCKDYITEKFFRPIRAGTVPVVWGARKEDYLRFMPESGFIFAEDYESVDDLYKYLLYLDKNDESYLGYFDGRHCNHPTTEKKPSFVASAAFCTVFTLMMLTQYLFICWIAAKRTFQVNRRGNLPETSPNGIHGRRIQNAFRPT